MQKTWISLKVLNLALSVAFLCGRAWAGNNGYFTTYNSEVERGEFELMLMTDLTTPSEFWRMIAFTSSSTRLISSALIAWQWLKSKRK